MIRRSLLCSVLCALVVAGRSASGAHAAGHPASALSPVLHASTELLRHALAENDREIKVDDDRQARRGLQYSYRYYCPSEAHATLISQSDGVCSYECDPGFFNFGTTWGGHCAACSGGEHMIESLDSCSCEDGYHPNYRPDSSIPCGRSDDQLCCLRCSSFPHKHTVGTGSDPMCVCQDGYYSTKTGCLPCSSIPHAVKSGDMCVCERGYFWADGHDKCELQQTCAAQRTSCPLADESTGVSRWPTSLHII